MLELGRPRKMAAAAAGLALLFAAAIAAERGDLGLAAGSERQRAADADGYRGTAALANDAGGSGARLSGVKHAYVTVLYDDSYVLPVRVLMESLLIHSPDVAKGERDRVVLVTSKVGADSVELLVEDGLVVLHASEIPNPYVKSHLYQPRFASVMCKLHIFNLTQYLRVMYIDADSLAVDDLSAAFSCDGALCARFLDPCYFNTGVMVVQPSATLFETLLAKLKLVDSYDGSDQGFLNSVFSDKLYFAPTCRFDRDFELEPNSDRVCRLPAGYHVDGGAYYNKMRWDEPPLGRFLRRARSDLSDVDDEYKNRLIHFVGPTAIKPWLWLPAAVLDLSHEWQRYRALVDRKTIARRRKALSAATHFDSNQPNAHHGSQMVRKSATVAVAGVKRLVLRTTLGKDELGLEERLVAMLCAMTAALWLAFVLGMRSAVRPRLAMLNARCAWLRAEREMFVAYAASAALMWLLCGSVMTVWLMPPRPTLPQGCALFIAGKALLSSCVIMAVAALSMVQTCEADAADLFLFEERAAYQEPAMSRGVSLSSTAVERLSGTAARSVLVSASLRSAVRRSLAFVCGEAALPVLYVLLMNALSYSSLLSKAAVVCIAGGLLYVVVVPAWVGFVALAWIRWSTDVVFQGVKQS